VWIGLGVPRDPIRIVAAVRFDQSYLAGQSFFEPYPRPLLSLTDSGK
jgi:uncharacterized protein YbgA (DUF1722 family)